MKVNLSVLGQGVVSPAGVGMESLLHRKPPLTQIVALGSPIHSWPVLRVDLKDPALVRWQCEPRLRRASSITFFLAEAAEQALAGVDKAQRRQTGLIVAFSAGCLAYSRRFFQEVLTFGQKTASPALFPETVFNSPVSHIASVLGLNGAAYALVGDEAAWIAALQTAAVWLQQKRVRQVLVLGAEEFDPIVLDAYRSVRWLRRENSNHGFLTSEGAAGILVSDSGPRNVPRITMACDGLIYRSKPQVAAAAATLLRDIDPAIPVYCNAQRNWLGPFEKKVTENRTTVSIESHPYLGEAFTASSAWRTLLAFSKLTARLPRLLLPVWGLNHQLGLLDLERH